MGATALYENIEGYGNVAIGHDAGRNNLGDDNVFIGRFAGKFETGSDRLYINNINEDFLFDIIYK